MDNKLIIADIYHLPQYSIYDKRRRKINRPIKIKFASTFDVQKFTPNLKHLKAYTEKRKVECVSIPYVYTSEHLLKELQLQNELTFLVSRNKRLFGDYKMASTVSL